MVRKILAFVLCGLMLLSLAACEKNTVGKAQLTENKNQNKTDNQNTIRLVENAYNDALALAKREGADQNYAYALLRNDLFVLLAELNQDEYNKTSIQKFFGPVENKEEAIQLINKTLMYVVDEDDDHLSALMRMFSSSKYVTGTIDAKTVDIMVDNIDLLLEELHIQPDVLGKILAMLDIYDYTWLSDEDPLLQFTDTGFTYHWKDLTEHPLELERQSYQLKKQDFIIKLIGEDFEEIDAIQFFKESSKTKEALWIYEDKNMDEDDEYAYEQILTNRGIYVGASFDAVLMAYGEAPLHRVNKDGLPHPEIIQESLRDDYIVTLLEKRCSTYVIYNYKTTYDICICFDDKKIVSWIFYFCDA